MILLQGRRISLVARLTRPYSKSRMAVAAIQQRRIPALIILIGRIVQHQSAMRSKAEV
jgi:ribosomal protein L39E